MNGDVVWSVNILIGIGLVGVASWIYIILKEAYLESK